MEPKVPAESRTDDLFRLRLDQIINPRHELSLLANKIDWDHIASEVAPCFACTGRPALPSRFMAGLFLLKSMYGLSDELVYERWLESPYFQYFCGETYFQHTFPVDRSSLTYWRKRVGESFFELLLQESLRIAFEEKALKKNQLKRIVVDTTVQPKAISFPTDSKLMYKALTALVESAKEKNITLRQTYIRVCKTALVKSGRYRHAKQMKRAKREERYIRTRLGRVIRDLYRQTKGDKALYAWFKPMLERAEVIQKQQRHSK